MFHKPVQIHPNPFHAHRLVSFWKTSFKAFGETQRFFPCWFYPQLSFIYSVIWASNHGGKPQTSYPVSSTWSAIRSVLVGLKCHCILIKHMFSIPWAKRPKIPDILTLHDWNSTPVNRYTVYIQPYWMISFQCCRISTIIEATTRKWLCSRMEWNPSERHQRGTDKVAVSRLQRPKFRGLSKGKKLRFQSLAGDKRLAS